jgi:GNAT superfamily N-acetyltransferase
VTASTDPRRPGEAARIVDLATGATAAEWLALSTAAHWNQTEDDWRTMLALGRGWGLRCADVAGVTGATGAAGTAGAAGAAGAPGPDTLVASTLVLPFGEGTTEGQAASHAAGHAAGGFAWISMVLVLPHWRGRGFAQRLLRVAIDDLAAAGRTPVLDATPAGRPVYLKQGFVDGWGFTRWRRRAALAAADATVGPAAPGPAVRRLVAADWPAVTQLDTPAFGADRTALLRRLAPRLPEAAWIAGDGDRAGGFLLGRDGRTALQLGPLVADDEASACALLEAAFPAVAACAAQRGLDVVADLHDGRGLVAQWLRQHGFAAERPFTRMVLGAAAPPGDARRIMMPAGPELG